MSPLDRLYPPPLLERLTKALAVLDAILEPEWEYRYYSFNAKFDEATKQRLATMRNGQGDEWILAFAPEGAFLKGFAHESPVASARMPARLFLDGLPPSLSMFASEPAFDMDSVTFCAWCVDGVHWSRARVTLPPGDDPDGARELLSILDDAPETYVEYAAAYYEQEIPLDVVRALYAGRPLTSELVRALDPERSLDDLAADLDEIGWPVGRAN